MDGLVDDLPTEKDLEVDKQPEGEGDQEDEDDEDEEDDTGEKEDVLALEAAADAAEKYRAYLDDHFDVNSRASTRLGSRIPTAFVYDDYLLLHKHPYKYHPERPARIACIMKMLELTRLDKEMFKMDCRLVDKKALEFVHTLQHVDTVEMLRDSLVRTSLFSRLEGQSVYVNEHSSQAALLSAGGVLQLVQAVCAGTVRNGIAIVRPPGHHAEKQCCKGFCLYNNVAIAAAWASRRHLFEVEESSDSNSNGGRAAAAAEEEEVVAAVEEVRAGDGATIENPTEKKKHKQTKTNFRPVKTPTKVLIVDWDVHHGNGTQHMFEEDPNVLFFSVHRWDRGNFYPGGPDAGPSMVGRGAGYGTNINIGWNGVGPFGDAEYLAAWQHVLLPAARNFDPDLVIVSAGFDAAIGDPLGGCSVSPAGYGALLHELVALANGRVVVALEGGYSLKALAESCLACVSVLLDKPPPRSPYPLPPPSRQGLQSIAATIKAHKTGYFQANSRQQFAIMSDPEDYRNHFFDWTLGATLDLEVLIGPDPPSPTARTFTPNSHHHHQNEVDDNNSISNNNLSTDTAPSSRLSDLGEGLGLMRGPLLGGNDFMQDSPNMRLSPLNTQASASSTEDLTGTGIAFPNNQNNSI